MKHTLLLVLIAATGPVIAQSQAPTTRSGRPVDPKAVENLNRINDDRVKRGLKPLDAPGYIYVPADKRTPVATTPAAPTPVPPTAPVAPGLPRVEVAAAPATLRWVDLVNRIEFWPKQCTLKETLQFQGGVTVKAGQTVKVDGIKPNEVELSTLDDKTQFAASPEETDVLAVANAEYARLTPKQRTVTYDSLINRKELWPYKVRIAQTFDLGPGKRVNAGDEAIVRDVLRGKINVVSMKYWLNYDVAPPATDLLEQARQFVEAPNGAPSRLAADLEGKLINSVTGKPDPLPADANPRYIVFYRGSSTCSITRQFTPSLVKYYNETKPKHPEFEVVYIMTETPENTGKFARELGFSWRALDYDTAGKLAFAGRPIGSLLPQLIVFDRVGNVLANGTQQTAPTALAQLDALLNQPPAR